MDSLTSARIALMHAIDDVEAAIGTVRRAQEVEWVSALATRYHAELYGVIQDLARFRDHLEHTRAALT